MHAADQHMALAGRASRIAPGGVLLLQYHALSTIIGGRQWNALRHYFGPALFLYKDRAAAKPKRYLYTVLPGLNQECCGVGIRSSNFE